eukprot:6888282-Prymnesium_polylepis.1
MGDVFLLGRERSGFGLSSCSRKVHTFWAKRIAFSLWPTVVWPMMRPEAITGATCALRCRGWHE